MLDFIRVQFAMNRFLDFLWFPVTVAKSLEAEVLILSSFKEVTFIL